jgi:hypothetical protein
MSLFDSIAVSISSSGIFGEISSSNTTLNTALGVANNFLSGNSSLSSNTVLNTAIGMANNALGNSSLSGNTMLNTAIGVANNILGNSSLSNNTALSTAIGVGNSILNGGSNLSSFLPEIPGIGIASNILSGDSSLSNLLPEIPSNPLSEYFSGINDSEFFSNPLSEYFPGIEGLNTQNQYWNTPTPLFGGISPSEAKQIFDKMNSYSLAKKNLWLLELTSNLSNLADRFNLFATELEYEPFNVAGEKHRIGGAVADSVQGAEPVELRLTTLDDQTGTLKRWFANHHEAVARRDGTVGLPGTYAVKIKVVHSFITRDSNKGGYEDVGLFRPVNLAVSLSRREDGLQELQMSFTQLDTFMRP